MALGLRLHRGVSAVAAAAVVAGGLATAFAVAALDSGRASAVDCSTMTTPVLERGNPVTGQTLLTTSVEEATSAATRFGFTENRGTPFSAGARGQSGLASAHRLYNTSSRDFVWIVDPVERVTAVRKYGYVDQGPYFTVAATPSSCTVPVHRFVKDGRHRYAVTTEARQALQAGGWQDEGARFHAAPASGVTPPPVRPTLTPSATPNPTATTSRPTTVLPKPSSTLAPEGKPDASNTGVPAGTRLTRYTGPLTITQDGTVIDSKDVFGDLRIQARNVVIRNSYLHGGTGHPGTQTGIVDANSDKVFNLLVEHSTIRPDVPADTRDGIVGHEYTARFNHITRSTDGLGIFSKPGSSGVANVTAIGNFIHDLTFWNNTAFHTDGTHNDPIQIQGGSNIRVAGNTLVASVVPGDGPAPRGTHGSNGLLVQQNTGAVSNVVIENNWVDDGASSITIVAAKLDSIKVTVRNNRLGRNQFDFGGGSKYPIRIFDKANSQVDGLFTNRWADTGEMLSDATRDSGIRYGG